MRPAIIALCLALLTGCNRAPVPVMGDATITGLGLQIRDIHVHGTLTIECKYCFIENVSAEHLKIVGSDNSLYGVLSFDGKIDVEGDRNVVNK